MKQAFRIISRMKGYTALSLLGLIISLSGIVIISRYLYQEWTIDHFMPALDRTFLCCVQIEGEGDWRPIETFDPNHESQFVSPVLNQSDVECWTNIHLRAMYAVTPEKGETFYPQALSVDSAFAQVYPLEAVEGTLELQAKGQCMVSEELAARLFPGERAVGKTINVGQGDVNTVVGVFRQPSTKSSIRFDIADYADGDFYAPQNSIAIGVVRLREGTSVSDYNKRQPEQRLGMFIDRPVRYGLQPYTQELQKYFAKGYFSEYDCVVSTASPAHLWMLLFVALLLLGVGLFNFVNLFAVMRSHRRHELHVRRLFGASRWDVFDQLYAETFLVAVLTMIGVWTVVELAEPLLATYYNIEVLPQWKFDVGLTAIVILGLPLIASLTPSPSPKERGVPAKGLFNLPSLGEGLGVGFQFFISLSLLTVSFYFMRQLHVMMTADPGFRTKGLLSVLLQPNRNVESWSKEEWDAHLESAKTNRDIISQRLAANPHIKSYCFDPRLIDNNEIIVVNEKYKVHLVRINPKAMELFGIETVAGRTFNDSIDTYKQYLCMVNETAIRQLGIKDFRDYPLQFPQRLWYNNGYDFNSNPPYEIVGVVRDFHPGRMSEPLEPTAYLYDDSPDTYDSFFGFEGKYFLIDISEGHEEDVIRYLRDLVHEISGTNELNYQWVEDQRQDLYKEDQRTARIFVTFSLLAIAVTCLGVLGLMMFDVRRRFREIALRKVNGATFRDIALLLSRRYLIIFGITAIASLPVSLLVIHRLMASYTIHTSFAWWIPLVSIALILALCALTLWYQVWKATRIKPYKVLKEN